jgi:hypothetical protein
MITFVSDTVENKLRVSLKYECVTGLDNYCVTIEDLTFDSLVRGTHISYTGERESVARACYYSVLDGLRIGSRLGKQVARDAINGLK